MVWNVVSTNYHIIIPNQIYELMDPQKLVQHLLAMCANGTFQDKMLTCKMSQVQVFPKKFHIEFAASYFMGYVFVKFN